jgi:cytochrome c
MSFRSRSPAVLAVLVLPLLAGACVGGETEGADARVVTGDATAGARVIRQAGCGACHRIPGIREARGLLAAPLTAFAARSFIAGELPNTADNLARWIRSPRSIEPRTAMPNLGLSETQARDVAAYLYTHD